MNQKIEYIKTSINEDEDTLLSSHFINDLLPEEKYYQNYNLEPLLDFIDNDVHPLQLRYQNSKKLNERQTEEFLIKPILTALGNSVMPQVNLDGNFLDFCIYDKEQGKFNKEFINTLAIVESKHFGRIENKYYIKKETNEDEIYQPFNYLSTVNRNLSARNLNHTVDYAILTDGYRWRLYSRSFTYSKKAFEEHFIEFNLEAIVNIKDRKLRNEYLRKFAVIFSKEAFQGQLLNFENESGERQRQVSTALKEQTFTALEYIATGIWRDIFNPNNIVLRRGLTDLYNIPFNQTDNSEVRKKALKLVCEESIVLLLRLLFVLYAEDRNLFDENIPKVIKGENGILSKIIAEEKGIGDLDSDVTPEIDDDIAIKRLFELIDNKYNGGLFSGKKHQLLHSVNISDILFLNALDHLCRVQIGKKTYTVDFSEISARELGSIYESLLEYNLAVVEENKKELSSILNKNHIRKNVKKGDLYLINQKGERKSSGSYYTNDLIVDHLVHTTLDEKLKKIKTETLEKKENFQFLLKKVLDLKICDPAMGSGHFLLAAYNRIIAFLQESLEILREEELETQFIWDEKTAFTVRSHVAIRCIYGVDLNEIAVEIAKLVLWMKVFRSDKPFEFYDSNLVCGNSLIGVTEDLTEQKEILNQISFWETKERMESRIQKKLLDYVEIMTKMPRNSIEEIETVKEFHESKIIPLQKQIDFMLNMELAPYLSPEKKDIVDKSLPKLVKNIDKDSEYVQKILSHSPKISNEMRVLEEINKEIISEYNPIHWRNKFPHIALRGGFDVILSNPPWDTLKAYWHEFLANKYADNIDFLNSIKGMTQEEALKKFPDLNQEWKVFKSHFEKENFLFNSTYKYQKLKTKNSKTLKGYNNLYKLFIEKIHSLLIEDGLGGLVVPDNLNLDAGTAGLRSLLLNKFTIKELIMFENRMQLFKDVHRSYKFDVLTLQKKIPRKNGGFNAGFYWQDPIWLNQKPDEEYLKRNSKSAPEKHRSFRYPYKIIRELDEVSLIIPEFTDKQFIEILKKISAFPAIGDSTQDLYIQSYSEFNMTTDKDLFNEDQEGWPLYQGRTIHHFNNQYNSVEKWVDPDEGEKRLSKRKKLERKDLKNRTYRIAWRDIARTTDKRSLICTILPPYVFCGNKLHLIDLIYQNQISDERKLISGINVIMSSFTADFFIRLKIATSVSDFIFKSLPIPRNIEKIKQLGELALPLYSEREMDEFRDGIEPLIDLYQRENLKARLDAEVAYLYGLTYHEYENILKTFPSIDKNYKKTCLLEFNKLLFKS